jgi:predicted dehydrogenase
MQVTISFGGQHALNYSLDGSGRSPWYFEEGKHGGTLTDIAVHGIDIAQWITGSRVARVVGARAWNTGRAPHIKDAAQCMLELENGVGVMGDASYLAPESVGQSSASHGRWRHFQFVMLPPVHVCFVWVFTHEICRGP